MPDLVLILAEDTRSARFLFRYARLLEPKSLIRILEVSAGSGAGEQRVREKYAKEVMAQRAVHRRCALLVHTDADNLTVAARKAQLDKALACVPATPRGAGERIALVIPKRNTETWLHGLTGNPADETYDYKVDEKHKVATQGSQHEQVWKQAIAPAAEALYQLTRPNAQPAPLDLPSLSAAVAELRRLG